MRSVNHGKTREFCLRLLRAESEEEVIEVLQKQGFWDDRRVWKPYGNIPNNRGIVGNQQSSPVAALVEKIVNSIDAVLTAECYRNGIDPTGHQAPKMMQSAVEKFLHVPGGRIQNLDGKARTPFAERIQLIACGTKEHPCYLIIDDGEGQTPDQFPNTFLSLLGENKTRIPFVQGKYNMGGTGVLQFAGTHSFQLIISRRQPDIPRPVSGSLSMPWGFTLIRRLEPGPEQPQSTYVYLAPSDQIPSFEADYLPIRPGRYPDAYKESLLAGTCIKLWNYKLPGRLKTIATLDLRYALERHLQDPALPIRVCERRPGYRAHFYDTTMSGLCSILADSREDIEAGLDTGSPLDVPGVGHVDLRIVVIREGVGDKRYPSGVFFNVNGQLHSELGSDFISRRTKLDYIAESMIVMTDCTSLPPRIREDLFHASRDRMRQCEERAALEESISEYLKDHPGLRDLNARRRQSRLSEALSENETTVVIQDLVKSDPTLAALFGHGQRIKIPDSGPIPEPEPYVGRQFPTYFCIAKEPKSGLVKRCPRNHTCRVEFETDATNDYFTRSTDSGHLKSLGLPILKSIHLWNGKATLRYALPVTCNIGDSLRVEVSIMDVSRVDPLKSSFLIEVELEVPPGPSGPPSPPHGTMLTGLPNIVEVKRDEWARHNFNEQSALELKCGEDDTLDMFINMDNIHLRNEIARRRNVEPDLLQYWFKYGLCLLALGILYQQRQSQQHPDSLTNLGANDEHGTENFESIAEACRGLAVTVIPVISQLSRGRTHGELQHSSHTRRD
ncbi:MAG TPA: hypothetical protein ACFYD2_08465 [Candidatus Avalokitesvara rifleensis]|uniref:hypothetical protein n=1 Tax=Candidatus Avalokitesvara rifleensis TaxID=3367620 RepID=UPI004026F87E